MQSPVNLSEVLAKSPEQITKEERTTILNAIYRQNPALGNPRPKYEAHAEAVVPDSLAIKEPICEELDDEYLPTCCRNGNQHRHPV